MTRAALLSLLSVPASLPAAAVPDLEQLAQAFPYCQTAHLLLAKAAHDQGSMLAGQRLRRAATYAADRQLLRELLERPAAPLSKPGGEEPESEGPGQVASSPSSGFTVGENTFEEEPKADLNDSAPLAEVELGAADAPELPLPSSQAAEQVATNPAQFPPAADSVGAVSASPDVAGSLSAVPVPADAAQPPLNEWQAPAASAAIEVEQASAAPAPVEDMLMESAVVEGIAAETALAAPAPGSTNALLPIRPSAEAGTARFEFGLSPALETAFTAYQLPDLPAAEPAPAALPTSAVSGPAAFTGSVEFAYALQGGSRLGYALLPADPPATGPAGSSPQTPGTTLPAATEFFPPDALLLEHLAKQSVLVPVVAAPSSLDLIDSFLRRAPQRRRGIVTLLTVPEQADLSMRSTQAESDLASESLARILAGQGKLERAISVYERLMVRQPEKSAYFAVQIELLRHPPTPSS